MLFLPKERLNELAKKPIFTVSEWEIVPTSFNDSLQPNVTADLFCSKCEKEKTYTGKAYSRSDLGIKYQQENSDFSRNPYAPFFDDDSDTETVEEMIDECVLPVGDTITVQLSCPTCGSLVYICYVIEFNKDQKRVRNVFEESKSEPDKYRVHKIGEYPNQETTRLHSLNKYKIRFPEEYRLLAQGERAFYDKLGTGAIVYIRKAYESLLLGILKVHNITSPNNFRQLLKCADEAAHIVPEVLSTKAYGLFGEISNIVHGDTKDAWGLDKYEDLRDVFCLILDNIMEKERQEKLASKIQTDNDTTNRRK